MMPTLLSSPDVTLWINVALATATLVVACVAVIVGIGALIGYVAAKRVIRRNTQRHAKAAVSDYLKSDEFKVELRAVADELLKGHIQGKIIYALREAPLEKSAEHRTELKEWLPLVSGATCWR